MREKVTIGKFELTGRLGLLPPAVEAFKARQTGLEREVELRIFVPPRNERRASALRMAFGLENRILAAVDSPYLPDLIDRGLAGNHPFYCVPLKKRLILADLLRGAPPDLRRRLSFFRHLLEALKMLHEEGFAVLDLTSMQAALDESTNMLYLNRLPRAFAVERSSGDLQRHLNCFEDSHPLNAELRLPENIRMMEKPRSFLRGVDTWMALRLLGELLCWKRLDTVSDLEPTAAATPDLPRAVLEFVADRLVPLMQSDDISSTIRSLDMEVLEKFLEELEHRLLVEEELERSMTSIPVLESDEDDGEGKAVPRGERIWGPVSDTSYISIVVLLCIGIAYLLWQLSGELIPSGWRRRPASGAGAGAVVRANPGGSKVQYRSFRRSRRYGRPSAVPFYKSAEYRKRSKELLALVIGSGGGKEKNAGGGASFEQLWKTLRNWLLTIPKEDRRRYVATYGRLLDLKLKRHTAPVESMKTLRRLMERAADYIRNKPFLSRGEPR